MEGGGEKIEKTKEKQKRGMKKIDIKKRCQLAFAKRKGCIMKKANEIKILCDANVDLIRYSLGGMPYHSDDSSFKTMKWALSNEQLQEDGDHFLSYVLDEMSKVDMQNFIEKSDSLMNRLNAEKERAKTLSRILKIIKNDSSITNWWDSIGESYEKNKENKKALLILRNILKDQKSKLVKRS